MRTLKLLFLLVLTTGLFMTISCKKGDVGPKGPAGPDSVTYSKWIPMAMNDDGLDSDPSSPTYNLELYDQTVASSTITSAIVNKGVILTYLLGFDQNTGDSLVVDASGYLTEFFTTGSILLNSVSNNYEGFFFRYVLVPGTISVSSVSGEVKNYTAKELAAMDYKSLTGLLNISAKSSNIK